MSRAQLLAGLRTGGPRSSSPSAVEDGMFQAQQNSSPVSAQDSSKTASPNTLKASAAVFTPGQRTVSPKREQTPSRQNSTEGQQQLLEAHFAALRVQQAMALQSQNSLAALYGAAQGQPQQQQQQYSAQQQAYEALVHQHQQQEEIRRQQSAAIAQLDHLRAQAANTTQQQQQRALVAQIQAEYERQAQLALLAEQVQAQQLQSSAVEQRQAAQATIQANLRNRQTQQAYAQLLEQQQRNQQQEQQGQAQAEADLMQRLQHIQLHYAVQQQQQAALGISQTASPPMRAAQQLNRAGSPSDKSNGRQRQPSHADAASSWRQRATGASNASTPSIVVDDSASDNGSASDVHTPDTSDEDVRDRIGLDKVQAAAAAMTARYGAPVDKQQQQAKSIPSVPRAISLSAAPRSRNFTAEAKSAAMSQTGSGSASSSGHLAAPTQPARQPRGPPTDFQPVNFASRISARTRKEAMSRLCASPRAASFSQRVVSVV